MTNVVLMQRLTAVSAKSVLFCSHLFSSGSCFPSFSIAAMSGGAQGEINTLKLSSVFFAADQCQYGPLVALQSPHTLYHEFDHLFAAPRLLSRL